MQRHSYLLLLVTMLCIEPLQANRFEALYVFMKNLNSLPTPDFIDRNAMIDNFWQGCFLGTVASSAFLVVASIQYDKYITHKHIIKPERILRIAIVLNNELQELRKVCCKEIDLNKSTMHYYIGNIDIMRLPHLQDQDFYYLLKTDEHLYAEIEHILRTFKRIVDMLVVRKYNVTVLKKDLLTRISNTYELLSKYLLQESNDLTYKLSSLIKPDDRIIHFLTH